MPRQCVWAMARPPAAAVSSRKSRRWSASGVATSPKVIGTELETARSRMRQSARDRTSGSAAIMPPSPFKDARPELGITPTNARTSSHEASREATGRSSEVWWCTMRDVENPIAPARNDSSSWRHMSSRSSSLAWSVNARSPMAQVRRAEWPTLAAKLMPFGRRSTASRYSGNVSKLQSIPGRARRVDVLGPLKVPYNELACIGSDRSKREPAVPHDGRCHSVPTRAGSCRVPEHLCVHVGMPVDEPGRDDMAIGIDLGGAPVRDGADLRDHPTGDTDVGPKGPFADPSTTVPPRITMSWGMAPLSSWGLMNLY